MRYYLLLLLLAAVLPASAQIFVNKVDVNSRPVQYIEVWETFNKDNGKFFAMLDYGQQDDLEDREGKLLFVTNKDGQYLEFNSMVDALNFMFRNGWEVLHVKTTAKVQSYILRKRKDAVDNSATKKGNNTLANSVQTETAQKRSEKTKVTPTKTKAAPKTMAKEKGKKAIKNETPVPAVEVKRVPKTKEQSTKEDNK